MAYNHYDFCKLVKRCIDCLDFNEYLPGPDQLATNSFGIHLTYLWAIDGTQPKDSLIIYSTEHRMKRGSHWSLLKKKKAIPSSVKLYKGEFISDVFIEKNNNDFFTPLAAAEIEASPRHTTSYSWVNNDYLRDFSKLLYLFVPKRLFVGCTTAKELDNLQLSLLEGYNHMGIKARNLLTAVVLLPAGTRQHHEIRIGIGSRHCLKFSKLFTKESNEV
jgi:hypothetical protein